MRLSIHIDRLEATKEELRVKGERQERERVELSLRLEELAERAAETQSLRDELDVLRFFSSFKFLTVKISPIYLISVLRKRHFGHMNLKVFLET